jgi:serine/threonine protein kinase
MAKYGNSLSDYEVLGQLGRGATAYVYRVRSRNAHHQAQQFALKVIDKDEIKKKGLERRVKNEIEIHIMLNTQFQLIQKDTQNGA